MTHRILIPAICLSLGLLAGCERESETTTTDTTTPAATPAEQRTATQSTPSYDTTTAPSQTTSTTPGQTTAQSGQQHNATGTVTAIDTEGNTVTVEHQAVASLNWPAMTMTFEVQDPNQLQDLQSGDQVEFAFVDAGNNRYLIQQISEQSGPSRLSQQDDDAMPDNQQ